MIVYQVYAFFIYKNGLQLILGEVRLKNQTFNY